MRRGLILLLACAFVLSCTYVGQDETIVEQPGPEYGYNGFVPGSAEVRFTPDMAAMIEEALASGSLVTKSASVNDVFESLGVSSLERLFPYAGEYEERTRREGLHCWYRVSFDESVPFTRSEASFGSLEGVEVFEPERAIGLDALYNDNLFNVQWNMFNSGVIGENYRFRCDINVVPVWKEYTSGDPSVIVAVNDVGVDYAHEDLSANYRGGYNFYDRDSVIIAGDHATHIAGIVAAVSNNKKGVCGVAGGDYANGRPGAGILSCQIFPGAGRSGSASGAEAIKWAADHGALISQNSWGYTFKTEDEARDGVIAGSLRAAIDYFIEYAGCDNDGNQLPNSPMKGGLVVFSAGNEAFRYNPIGEYDPVLCVGAVAADYNRAYYSNYGDWVDICAPGGDRQKATEVMSTLPGNKYGYMQGTSMAAPHVSGVAALVVSYRGGPGYTCEDLREQLIGGANSSAISPVQKIGPLLDALGAVTYGSTLAPAKVSSYEAEVDGHDINLSWKVTTDERGVRAYGYKAFVTSEESWLDGIDYGRDIPGIVSETVYVGDLEAGDPIELTISDLDFDSPYYVMIVGFSYNGVYSQPSEIKRLHVDRPPVVDREIEDFVLVLGEEESFDLGDYISDPDGDELQYSVTSSSPIAVAKPDVSGSRLTVSAIGRGFTEFVVIGSDAGGRSVWFEFQVYVYDPSNPVDFVSTTVSEKLVVRTARLMDTRIRISGQTGKVMFDKTMQVGAFQPATIDVSAFPPGVYKVAVTMEGKTYDNRIVKI